MVTVLNKVLEGKITKEEVLKNEEKVNNLLDKFFTDEEINYIIEITAEYDDYSTIGNYNRCKAIARKMNITVDELMLWRGSDWFGF